MFKLSPNRCHNRFGITLREFSRAIILLLALQASCDICFATARYVSPSGANLPPFADWSSAATNIQDAIDVASPGDVVWVTNGVYSSGGKVMSGDLTNRVALDKALRVQSINGPLATTIEGAWDTGVITGLSSVRCAWLTNGAVLSGFTIRGGATRGFSGPAAQLSGGGVWGVSASALVTNCMIIGNSASLNGGGANQVTLMNCTLRNNNAGTGSNSGYGGGASSCNLTNCIIVRNSCSWGGGGTYSSYLKNCAVIQNSANVSGGGVYYGALVNCTVTGNYGYPGGGAVNATLINCIVASNRTQFSDSQSNYSGCTFSFSCSSPLPAGSGNISADPQLLNDGVHTGATSPCRGAGSNVATGKDIDGQSWGSPPSIGCDEWLPEPVIASQPQVRLTGIPIALNIGSFVVGQEPFGYWWYKDGELLSDGVHFSSTRTTNLTVNGFGPSDAGSYSIIASNAFGMATSSVAQIIVHCADAVGGMPAPPYSNWLTAAASIQDAIDAATAGDVVLVTNGVYDNGGRTVVGDLTNRVAVTKALTVVSVNGPAATTIQGAWDPASTNGPLAVRCAWLADGGRLSGFTLQRGATRNTGDLFLGQCGGAVWAISSNAIAVNCLITNNASQFNGGGVYGGMLNRCILVGNWSQWGGGAAYSTLINCLVRGNSANNGGGAYYGSSFNCTITGNSAVFNGGGTYEVLTRNGIVYGNSPAGSTYANWYSSPANFAYSCTTPLAPGSGNISTFPQLLDGIHLASTSPCRGAGSPIYSSESDVDDEPWLSPPSIGCDEFVETNIIGPLSVGLTASMPAVTEKRFLGLSGQILGRASRLGWSFGDGAILTNASYVGLSYAWTNPGDYMVTFTAFNMDNPNGVSTNLLVHVLPLAAPILSAPALTGSVFSLSFPAQPGVFYYIERTTNLMPPVIWQRLATLFSSDTNLLKVNDTRATNAMGFYRVRVQ